MKNLILFTSFIPFICIALFADPTQGAFSKNLGSLSSTFIAGILAFLVFKKYGDKNGLGASIAWGAILAIGLSIATLFNVIIT